MIERCDHKKFSFESRNILLDSSKSYYSYLHLDNYRETVVWIASCAKRASTDSRKNPFFQFGSTTGSAKYPKFRASKDSDAESMLPRPVVCCRPNKLGWHLQQHSWLIDLVSDIETYTILYIKENRNFFPHAEELLLQLHDFKHGVDSNLLICETFFNQMIMIGELDRNGDMNLHVDKEDAVSCVLHLGEVNKGGSTNYYNGLKAGKNVPASFNGDLVHSVPFEHGRLQIGLYKDVIHGVDSWEGSRITIDFNTKISVLNHYSIFGNQFTDQFKDAGYPAGNFLAK